MPSDVKWNAAPYPSSDHGFLECLRAEHGRWHLLSRHRRIFAMARAKPASKKNSRRTLPLSGAAGSVTGDGGRLPPSAAASTADVTPPRNDPALPPFSTKRNFSDR